MRWKRKAELEREETKKIRNKFIFGACTVISGAAAMFWVNVLPVMAEENAGEEVAMGVGDNVGTGARTDANIDADAGNHDGDILAGNITNSKLQTLPSTGEIIVGLETAANLWLSVGLEFAGRVRVVRNPVHVW